MSRPTERGFYMNTYIQMYYGKLTTKTDSITRLFREESIQ